MTQGALCEDGVPAERSLSLRAHAKVNLSLYVTGRRDDGYHDIVSVMQDISLYDEVSVGMHSYTNCSAAAADDIEENAAAENCGYSIKLKMQGSDIPCDERNLAYRGAKAVLEAVSARSSAAVKQCGVENDGAMTTGSTAKPKVEVDVTVVKKLPVSAGIAGGSGNAAAVMLAVNHLLGCPCSLRELMEIGAAIGADVPFSLMMNAYRNREILGAACDDSSGETGNSGLSGIEEARPAALMRGIGDIVAPVEPIKKYVILMNPGTEVSTAAAYAAVDAAPYDAGSYELYYNIFEKFIYSEDPEAGRLRSAMDANLRAEHILLSGSGPTIVAYYSGEETAKEDYRNALSAGWMEKEWRIWYAISGGENYEL